MEGVGKGEIPCGCGLGFLFSRFAAGEGRLGDASHGGERGGNGANGVGEWRGPRARAQEARCGGFGCHCGGGGGGGWGGGVLVVIRECSAGIDQSAKS